MKLYNITYFIREALSSIVTHRFMSFAAAGVICACLLITGSFLMVAVNVENILDEVENQNEVVVFVDESYDEDTARELKDTLLDVDNVADAVFVSKEEAFSKFQNELGEESELLEGLENDNPLRNRFTLKLHDISKTASTAKALERVDGIAKVQARSDISDKILQVRGLVTAICLVLIIVLLAVSVFIISNTVNLTIFNRREEIAIMKMVGATNGFVRIPFVIEGMLLGLAGAVIALFLQWCVYVYVSRTALEGIQMFNIIGFGELFVPLLSIFMGVGVFVGCIGSAIILRKFLKV